MSQSITVMPALDTVSGKALKKETAIKIRPAANIYPNPAKNKAEISVNGFEPGYLQIQMADVKGNLVRNDTRLLLTGNEVVLMMFSLSPGIYFITLKQKEKMLRKRLLVH
ncbi:MAG: T9SS type A sorting domain-containing protein [Ferruginibacter sp.]